MKKIFSAAFCLSLTACVSPQIRHQTGPAPKSNSTTSASGAASASNSGANSSSANAGNSSVGTGASGSLTAGAAGGLGGASGASTGTAAAAGTSGASNVDGTTSSAALGSAAAPAPMPTLVRPPIPRIGIILGPGGAKTYAHIAFLHELAKSKVPVHSVVGIEFAAPIAALFSKASSANEVEWQMFKIKDEDLFKKSLLSRESKSSDVGIVADSLKSIFQDQKAEGGRIPFMCPSLNLQKSQTYWMNRGALTQVLPFCMAYPPLFKPYQASIASTRELKSTADYLRKLGANVVVFVNVLSQPYSGSAPTDESMADEVLWSELAYLYRAPAGSDLVLNLDAGGFGVGAFSNRREIFQASKDSAQKAVNLLTHKLDL